MKKQKAKSIKSKIIGLTLVTSIILSVLLMAVMIYSIFTVDSNTNSIAVDNLLNQVKTGIQANTTAIVSISTAQYEKEKNETSENQLVDKILDNIRNTKYSETGYYFVYQYDGVRLVAPENKAQEGKNLWDLEDENGYKPVQEFIKQAKAGGGFVSYMWLNPKSNTPEEKISYVAPLKMGGMEVLVGTGTYLPMVEATKAEIRQSSQNVISTLLYITIPGILVITLIILIMTYYFYSKNVIKPIQKTADAAAKLAGGDTDVTIGIKSNDEVGHLAETIDNEVRQAFIEIGKAQAISEKQKLYMANQVDKLIVNLERLSKGELYCDMAVAESDADTAELYELYGRISDSLHLTVNTLKTYIEEISETLGTISDGNLNVSIKSEYRGDFVTLKNSINSIAESLSRVLSDINTAAEQVATGTRQVSEGSQEISQGSTEQASAIEQLTTSVTQIAEQTRQNAISANKANELTLSAKDDAGHGNEQMKAMQQAMSDINESSENISKIIKVIDDIAFQTNILALNAAVEAARAGIHGKGFAVVAEEVRNLAARSTNAAKETTDLIEGSIKKAEVGRKIADETAGALASIVKGVDTAAQLVGEIAAASNEQASAITQVNGGIEQMSQVVQTNSATSEEAAASAEELSSQAEMLKAMVGRFKLKTNASTSSNAKVKREDVPEKTAKSYIALSDSEFGKY